MKFYPKKDLMKGIIKKTFKNDLIQGPPLTLTVPGHNKSVTVSECRSIHWFSIPGDHFWTKIM